MNGILATLARELRAYFFSPMAYVVLTCFLGINGAWFALLVSFLNEGASAPNAPMEFFFGGFLFWLVLLAVGSVLPMRLLSEERKSGTIEVLMTAPVSETQVVVGKYLAALGFYLFLWLPTLVYAVIIGYNSDLDWGPIASSYLGVLGIGALFLAVGIFASALTRHQIVAAILAFAMVSCLFMFGLLEFLVNDSAMREVLSYINLLQHMEDFGKGIVDTRTLVYYVSGVTFFLFLTSRTLDANKWR